MVTKVKGDPCQAHEVSKIRADSWKTCRFQKLSDGFAVAILGEEKIFTHHSLSY